MSDLHDMSLAELATQLRSRRVSAVETAQHFLQRAEGHLAHRTADAHHTGAFLAMDAELTMAQARAADARIAAGQAGALEGVPIAHKDIFVTRDFPTTAGSRMLRDYRSPFDATVVQRG